MNNRIYKKLIYLFLINFSSCGINSLAKVLQEEIKKELLVVGSSQDLSRGLKTMCNHMADAMRVVFQETNQEGGINGRELRLIVLDDKYDPVQARKNIERFLDEYKTDITLSSMGSPTLPGYLDLVEKKKVLVVFPSTGAFHTPKYPYIVFYRPSFFDTGYLLVKYMIDTFQLRKFVFFYQNDEWGKGVLEGAIAKLKEAGITNWKQVSYDRNDVNFLSQAKKIKEMDFEAIGFFAVPTAVQEVVRQVGVSKFVGRKLFCTDIAEEFFKKFIEEKGLKFINTSVVPNPEKSDLEIVKNYREAAKRCHMGLDPYGLEGFISATIFVEVLKKIDGQITKEKILEVIEKIKDYGFKGLTLNFDPKTRALSNTIWLDTGKEEWVPVKREMKEVEPPRSEIEG